MSIENDDDLKERVIHMAEYACKVFDIQNQDTHAHFMVCVMTEKGLVNATCCPAGEAQILATLITQQPENEEIAALRPGEKGN